MSFTGRFQRCRQQIIERESGLVLTFFRHRHDGSISFDVMMPRCGEFDAVTISGEDVRLPTQAEAVDVAARLADRLEHTILLDRQHLAAATQRHSKAA